MNKTWVAAAALGLLLTGCGSDEERASKTAKEENAPKEEVKKQEAPVKTAGETKEENPEAVGNVDSKVVAAIEKDLLENMKYAEEENIEKYLDTLLISEQEKELTTQQMEPLFQSTDLDYNLESIKVLEAADDMAKVEAVQTTVAKKVEGNGQFKNNRVSAIHTMKLDNGMWKTAATEIKNVEYME
ncbi:hypothetical protein [Bacillus massilinigeriensis]|uniref:hypothetical protein n=1 Tax=Bacillus mediterraneensis TaxID=1805474 RepID=UPI0008F80180|nr:hypothetical protein [Bacillus mediterraneensis]